MNDLIKNSKSVDYVKNRVKARRFKKEDAKEVRNLIVRNFLEINSRDYGLSAMETLAKVYDEEKVLNVASYAHMYVFEFEEKIVGTGSISSFWGSETESILLCIFVLPEFHGKGIGRQYPGRFRVQGTCMADFFLFADAAQLRNHIVGGKARLFVYIENSVHVFSFVILLLSAAFQSAPTDC